MPTRTNPPVNIQAVTRANARRTWINQARLAREARRGDVARMAYRDLERPETIAQSLGIPLSTIKGDLRSIQLEAFQRCEQDIESSLGEHIRKLLEWEKEALEQYWASQTPALKLRWFNARLDVLKDLARVTGRDKAGASLFFAAETEDTRYAVVLSTPA